MSGSTELGSRLFDKPPAGILQVVAEVVGNEGRRGDLQAVERLGDFDAIEPGPGGGFDNLFQNGLTEICGTWRLSNGIRKGRMHLPTPVPILGCLSQCRLFRHVGLAGNVCCSGDASPETCAHLPEQLIITQIDMLPGIELA